MELKAGDVVMLKSGGQPLTVVDVKEEDVLCLWMGIEGNLFRETLPLAVLEQAEPEEDEDEDDEDEDEDEEEDDEDDE
ncbi:YodC family protein [Bradyrhizobium sp. UFLA05-112]